jgi:hypothetical protein
MFPGSILGAGTIAGHDKNNPFNSEADGLKIILGPYTSPSFEI